MRSKPCTASRVTGSESVAPGCSRSRKLGRPTQPNLPTQSSTTNHRSDQARSDMAIPHARPASFPAWLVAKSAGDLPFALPLFLAPLRGHGMCLVFSIFSRSVPSLFSALHYVWWDRENALAELTESIVRDCAVRSYRRKQSFFCHVAS